MHKLLFSPPDEVFLPVCSVSAISVFSSIMSGVAAVGTLSHWSLGFPGCFILQLYFLQFEGPFVHYDAIFIYGNQNIRE